MDHNMLFPYFSK